MDPDRRLLVLSFSPIHRDPRVLKQLALFRDDYGIATCGFGPQPEGSSAHFQLPDGLVTWPRSPLGLGLRRYSRVYWRNEAVRAARDLLAGQRFDVVLANDVETVPLALSLAPRCGVHADLHEYSPRQHDHRLLWRALIAPYVRWLCRAHVARASSTTTVGRGIAEEYRRVFGFSPEVVTNAAPYADLHPTPVASPVRLVHSGNAIRSRRLENLVDAVERTSTAVTLDLLLVANSGGYLDELRARAAGSERVTVREPVPYPELVATMNAYDVGIHILPPTNFNNRHALPNKIFEYLQSRLGVLVGPSPEMEGLVREHEVGAVTRDFGVDALVEVLDGLDVGAVARWKANAHASAQGLAAESQSLVWRAAVDRLVDRAAAR